MSAPKIVIIGGGPAGRSIVHVLHHSKKEFDLTVIKDEEVNANRCAIPYGIAPGKPTMKYTIPNTMITDFGAKLVMDKVVGVDLKEKKVKTAEKGEFEYDQVVFATGGAPIVPPIPGLEGAVDGKIKNLTTVRGFDDMEKMRKLAQEKKKVAVIGGGYIGLEVAVSLKKLGIESTVVEMLPHVLMMTTEEEFVADVEAHVLEKGLNLKLSSKVVAFVREGDDVVGVKFDDGDVLECDFVVLAIGVRPNTDLARAAGLEVTPLGIVADDHMEVVGHKGVYAVGDCVQKRMFGMDQFGRGEFGTNAVFMGKVAGKNILGTPAKFEGVINANVSTAFDLSFGSAGLTTRIAAFYKVPVVVGYSEVLDQYPMMNPTTIKTKLIFHKETRKLIGGSVIRKGLATGANIDFISFAIQMEASIEQLMKLQYATHPELAAKPSDNTVLFACKHALHKF
jgi:NADH dehydrogenase